VNKKIRDWHLYGAFYRSQLYSPCTPHRRTPRTMGHAEVQATQGQVRPGLGLVERCSPARARTLRPLVHAPPHPEPTCGSRMTGRLSRTALREPGGEIPPGYSPDPLLTFDWSTRVSERRAMTLGVRAIGSFRSRPVHAVWVPPPMSVALRQLRPSDPDVEPAPPAPR
jgi:hypothetical protein